MNVPFPCTEKDSGLRDRHIDVISSAPFRMSSQLVSFFKIKFEDSSLWLSSSRVDKVNFCLDYVMA